jgi:hypothetical protein
MQVTFIKLSKLISSLKILNSNQMSISYVLSIHYISKKIPASSSRIYSLIDTDTTKLLLFRAIWILTQYTDTSKRTHTCLCAQASMSPPTEYISIFTILYNNSACYIILLFPKLPCNVNSKCLWKEINTGSVLLTSTISGFSGGFTLLSCKACQSMTKKNGCVLMLSTLLEIPKL